MNNDGGGTLSGTDVYKISFTDAAGLGHTLRGVKKVQIDDIPATVRAPMPASPGMTGSDGKPFEEGSTYNWADGTKAKLHNGAWEAVQVPNDACQNVK